MSKPAHKQDDPRKMPGQIKNDVTLGDYIERKSKSMEKRLEIQKKKLTFEEWLTLYYGGVNALPTEITNFMLTAWNAGRENK